MFGSNKIQCCSINGKLYSIVLPKIQKVIGFVTNTVQVWDAIK